jgi:hypothetical protein
MHTDRTLVQGDSESMQKFPGIDHGRSGNLVGFNPLLEAQG